MDKIANNSELLEKKRKRTTEDQIQGKKPKLNTEQSSQIITSKSDFETKDTLISPQINYQSREQTNPEKTTKSLEPLNTLDKSMFNCPLCNYLLCEPVVTECGHTFCRNCLAKATIHSCKCPLCKVQIQKADKYGVCMLLQQILESYFNKELSSRVNEVATPYKVGQEVKMPLFVCSNVVLFPDRSVPVHITELKYKNMIKQSKRANNRFGLVYGTDDNLPKVGTVAFIKNQILLPDSKLYIQVIGQQRFEIKNTWMHDGYTMANVVILGEEDNDDSLEDMQMLRNYVYTGFSSALDSIEEKFGKMPSDPVSFIYWLVDFLPIPAKAKQSFLELSSTLERATALKHIVNVSSIGVRPPKSRGNW